jgi:sulfoxide reductase heme-binding subunit YedZ
MTALTSIFATAASPHLLWLASRAAGSAALVLASLSMCIGLSIGGRLVQRHTGELRVIHEALSLATLAALAIHGLTLLGDSYLRPSFLDISVPFAGSYKSFLTACGIVAFWALAVLGLGYYARALIGVSRWRRLHRFTALAWLLGLVHALGEGSDAGQAWFLAMTAIVIVPALVLLIARTFGSSASTRAASRASAVAPVAPRSASATRRAGAREGSSSPRPATRARSGASQAATSWSP